MGLDAVILFRSKTPEPELEWNLPDGFTVEKVSDYMTEEVPEATHTVDCGCARYYGPEYERGPWPALAAVLMTLIENPAIEKVWYGHDCCEPPEIDSAEVLRICAHFMEHGHHPYSQPNESSSATREEKP